MPNGLPDHEALIDIQHDIPRSNFEVYLSMSLSTILFLMASGDLNINLIQTVFTKFVGLSTSHQTPFTVCHFDLWFSRPEGGPKRPLPARFRTFQSPPRIGLIVALL